MAQSRQAMKTVGCAAGNAAAKSNVRPKLKHTGEHGGEQEQPGAGDEEEESCEAEVCVTRGGVGEPGQYCVRGQCGGEGVQRGEPPVRLLGGERGVAAEETEHKGG